MKMLRLVSLAAAFSATAAIAADDDVWDPLFKDDLSDADFPEGVWTVDDDGVLTASEDEAIWSQEEHANFELKLEFKNAEGTNSGVIVYCSDTENWIPNSVEIQIADDHSEQWASQPKTWQSGAIFGRLAPERSAVKKPGEWNTMKVICHGPIITVVLNDDKVTEMDMRKWTDAKTNPDGSEIPSWLNKPLATLPPKGHIGFQGKHAGAPIYFRNIQIRTLPAHD
ncbi:hypothetical protein BH23VER1_BH23VER1_31620 [soil metagenome]